MATKGVLGLPPKRAQAEEGGKTCGQCMWLDTAFKRGQTCRTHHGADDDSEVCEDFTRIDPKKLVGVPSLKRDPTVKKYLSVLDDPRFQVDETLQNELVDIKDALKALKDRETGIPVYYESEKDAEKLISFFLDIQAYRDRVVSVYLTLSPVLRRLEKVWDACEIYLNKYPIVSEQSTEGRKQKIVASVLEPLNDRIKLTKSIIALADKVDSYLNSSHFMLKEIKDIAVRALEIRKAGKYRPN